MRIWPVAGGAAVALLLGCGDVADNALAVDDSHVVRDGATGDVAVAWGKVSGVAAWAALDKRRVELVRIRDDGAPLATFREFPIGASGGTMLRAARTELGFAVVSAQPEAPGLVAALTEDVLLAGSTTLPIAKSVALAPPIVALVEPMEGRLLLGDVGNDSPRPPTALKNGPTGLIAVGAAFATRHGIVVMVSERGCVTSFSVNGQAKPIGHVSETRCLEGNWDKATVVAWPTDAQADPETFAIAVGFSGVVDGVPSTTKGFVVDLRVGSAGALTISRSSPAPIEPSANGFFGQDDAALQLAGGSGGVKAARFDAQGHPLDGGDTLVWDAGEAGGKRAVTATSAKTWIGMTVAGEGAKSKVLARAISLP